MRLMCIYISYVHRSTRKFTTCLHWEDWANRWSAEPLRRRGISISLSGFFCWNSPHSAVYTLIAYLRHCWGSVSDVARRWHCFTKGSIDLRLCICLIVCVWLYIHTYMSQIVTSVSCFAVSTVFVSTLKSVSLKLQRQTLRPWHHSL